MKNVLIPWFSFCFQSWHNLPCFLIHSIKNYSVNAFLLDMSIVIMHFRAIYISIFHKTHKTCARNCFQKLNWNKFPAVFWIFEVHFCTKMKPMGAFKLFIVLLCFFFSRTRKRTNKENERNSEQVWIIQILHTKTLLSYTYQKKKPRKEVYAMQRLR